MILYTMTDQQNNLRFLSLQHVRTVSFTITPNKYIASAVPSIARLTYKMLLSQALHKYILFEAARFSSHLDVETLLWHQI